MNRYSTFVPRLMAGVVDTLVFIPIGYLDDFLLAPQRSTQVLIVWSIVTYSAFWLYSVLLHARFGQTLGKMVMHIKVLDLSEQAIPSIRQAILRDSGYILLNTLTLIYTIQLILKGKYVQGSETSSMPGEVLIWASVGWFVLELVTMATNQKRRALHDFIAGTVVVRGA